MKILTQEHFLPYVGKVFRLEGGGRTFTLARVTLVRRMTFPDAPRAPFDVVFRGPPGDVLPKKFYRLYAEDGWSVVLYIEPKHTRVRDRQDYVAKFS
jgi:hypothetical protein